MSVTLTQLMPQLRAVAAKRRGLALGLWGDPGVGKTWTAQQLLAGLSCRSATFHAAKPLEQIALALPRPSKLPTWSKAALARLRRGEGLDPAATVDALGALLAALAPIILHLEDLHEVEAAQLKLLQTLVLSTIRIKGVGLLVASRTPPPAPFEAVRLEGLSAQEARALLESEVGAALPEAATDWVYGRAVGNPLFTLEYLRHLARQGYLWNDAQRWRWRNPPEGTIPTTIEALLERLIAQVSSGPPRDALEAAALLPAGAPVTLWSEVTGLSGKTLEAAKTALERLGLFQAGAFAHPLFREVTLQSLTLSRRRELSRRALAALEDDPQNAANFVADAGLEREGAVHLLKRAATAAREGNNLGRAAQLLAQAAACSSGAARAELALEAASSGLEVGYARVVPLIEGALPHLEDPSDALLMLAEAWALEGRREEMGEVLARLPQAARESPNWLTRYLKLLFTSSDFAQLIRVWNEHPRFQSEADPTTVYRVAYALVDNGQLEPARALVREHLERKGLTAGDTAGLLDICAMVAFYEGNSERADAFFTEALALYRRTDSWDGVANTLRNRALNRLQMGLYRESLPSFKEALAIYAERGRGLHYAQTLAMVSDPYIELGEYERAEETLHEALEMFGRAEPQPFLVNSLANLAVLYTDWQPPHGWLLANKHGERGLRVARELTSVPHVALAAVVASSAATFAGDAARGLELADEARQIAQEIGFQETLAKAELAVGLALAALGRTPEALDALREGARVAATYGNVLDTHKIGLELDRLTGNLEGARERLIWFEERGLLNGVNRAKRYFPELASKRAETQTGKTACLEVLGPIRVVRAGSAEGVRGEKRRQLLAMLLEARIGGRSEVDQLTLLDTLYPGEPEAAAATALKQLVFQLRKGLGDGVIVRTPDGYALGALVSDAEAFLKGGDTGLWRGVYLGDVSTSGETVRDALYYALKTRSSEVLERDPAEAARLGRILMDAEPYDVEVLRLTLKALRQDGNLRAAEKLYREGYKRLLEVGERLPESWRDFLEHKAP